MGQPKRYERHQNSLEGQLCNSIKQENEHHKSFQQPTASRKVMPPQTKNLWRRHVIDVLSGHPTLSINACAQVASSTANYAAELSHKTNVLYDYSIGRTYITEGLLRQGAESHLQLQALFSLFSSDNSCGVSVIVDFWSGRHQHRQSYGGIIACGLTQDWKWFSFPILLSELAPCSHDGAFTFNLLCDTVAPQHFVHPLFVCTDNEAKMCAAFDGRHLSTVNFGGRIGCVEHALSTCVKDVFEKSPAAALEALLSQLTAVENFYGTRDDRAKRLARSIPEKCVTRPWRYHYSRLLAAVDNYVVYREEPESAVVDNLPSLGVLKSLLLILNYTTQFFNRLENDGVTAHQSFLNYFSLDANLLNLIIDPATPQISLLVCQQLREVMRQKLWPYCGSSFSQAASYFSGVDVPSMINVQLSKFVGRSRVQQDFVSDWKSFIGNYLPVVEAYLSNLLPQIAQNEPAPAAAHPTTTPSCSSSMIDVYQELFELPAKRPHVSCGNEIVDEMRLFEASRAPSKDVIDMWKHMVRFPMLQQCAKVLLAIPVSSSAVERLFSQSGMLLTKLRRTMRPSVVSALVYNKSALKYRELITKHNISVSDDAINVYLSKLGGDGDESDEQD